MAIENESTDQVIRMVLQGSEVVLRLSGEAALRIAALIYNALKGDLTTKGKATLWEFLKSGKDQKLFRIPKVIANDSANAIVSMSEANIKAASSGIALDGNDCIDNFDTLYVTTATLQKDYAQYSSSLLNLIKRSEESISRTRAKYRPDSK